MTTNSTQKYIKISILLSTIFLVGCQQEEQKKASSEKVQESNSVEFAFKEKIELTNDEVVFCTGSRNRGTLALVALNLHPDEINGSEKNELLPHMSMQRCDLSKLTISGIENFQQGIKEIKVGPHIGLKFKSQSINEDNWIDITVQGVVSDPAFGFDYDKSRLEKQCSGLSKTPNQFGFFTVNSDCNEYDSNYENDPKYFIGYSENNGMLNKITCLGKAKVSHAGICILSTSFQNQHTIIVFSQTHVAKWLDVRHEATQFLESRTIAAVNKHMCKAKFCNKLKR